MFDRLDNISIQLRSRGINTPEECRGLLQEVNGILGFLNPILGIAETETRNRELRKYSSIKSDFEADPPLDKRGDPKNFTSAPAEKEAQAFVSPYRRIRNTMSSYTELSKTLSNSAQSLLKSLDEERAMMK